MHRNLGVHISFVRSLVLDDWSDAKLRTMRVGGNHAARVFFAKNGGSQYLNPGANATEKYTSAAAKKYLAELKRRAVADTNKNPGKEALDFGSVAAAISGGTVYPAAEASESNSSASSSTDDFFSNWDKKKAATPPISRSQTPVSRTASPAIASKPANGAPIKSASSTRIVPSKTKPASSILGRKSANSSILSSRSNPKKVVAKKVNASDVDFDAAERAAKEEEDHINQLGYNPNDSTSTNSGVNVKKLTTATAGLSLGSTGNGYTTAPAATKEEPRKPVKLGFGQTSIPNQATAGTAAPSARRTAPMPASDGSVVAKFGGQKAISSDQMFGRNSYDPEAQAEARTRLAAFKGASSISSSSYFGEEEEAVGSSGNGSESLERMAQDIAGRVKNFTGDDMNALKDALEQGATKLGGMMRDYLRW